MTPTAIKRLLQFSVWCALGISLVLPSRLEAAFVRDYGLSNFTLVNVNADGTAITPDNGLSVVLTGGNNGSGLAGTTTLKTAAAGNGWVKFDYAYTSKDDPGYDFAEYLLGLQFFWLADTNGDSGSVWFPVLAGQEFGFVVATEDNTIFPGVLTISNFDAPTGVPEPGMAPIAAVAVGAILCFGSRLRKPGRGRGKTA
jgi:hypothetical protein